MLPQRQAKDIRSRLDFVSVPPTFSLKYWKFQGLLPKEGLHVLSAGSTVSLTASVYDCAYRINTLLLFGLFSAPTLFFSFFFSNPSFIDQHLFTIPFHHLTFLVSSPSHACLITINSSVISFPPYPNTSPRSQ